MATFEDLIRRTITRLSMVPGYGTQTYAEDQIAEMIYHKFITARDELWWDDLMAYVTLTLDQDGVPHDRIVRELPVAPLGDEIVINKYADIQHVWWSGRMQPLPTIPRRTNPNETLYGGPFVFPHDDKVICIKGQVSDGNQIQLRYMRYYPMFEAQETVPFDDQLLILGACYDYLEDDGTNPSQIEKFNKMYTNRHDQLVRREGNEAIKIGA